ncbi:nuclear transport factor 2 family protein [Caballeronia sordidicola]|uniref:nuclear transport factor 2 family protein n=1 Tax=Caballeronia sordidicola TaxID=196367 RepID=UPI0026928864
MGPEAFVGFVKWLRGQYPELKLHIQRVIAEGDMVTTHSHLVLVPGEPGRALADFFRLENGKVVEHWDVIQDVPKSSVNSNGMF